MYYGIGLLIGLVLVLFMFGTRGCNWLPENRIKASVFSQILVLDTVDLKRIYANSEYIDLLSDGSVNLGLSMRKGEPKSYYFKNTKSFSEHRFAQVIFQTDGLVGIIKPVEENQKASTHVNDQWLPIVHVPGDSNFISFHEDVLNDIYFLGLTRNQIYESLKSSGVVQTIPYDKDPQNRNIHLLYFEHEGQYYRIRARVFKHALEILFIKALEDRTIE